nr:hypothetical protein [Nanoarchaeota archaeon]
MKPEELPEETLIRILEAYKKKLGDESIDILIKNPGLLLPHIHAYYNQDSHILYDRSGSRWTDDTKLGFFVNEKGDLEITVELEMRSSNKTEIVKAEKAKKEFLEEVKQYL